MVQVRGLPHKCDSLHLDSPKTHLKSLAWWHKPVIQDRASLKAGIAISLYYMTKCQVNDAKWKTPNDKHSSLSSDWPPTCHAHLLQDHAMHPPLHKHMHTYMKINTFDIHLTVALQSLTHALQ